ncbi:OmpP1/FadL family transporter [Shewanella intestini]|uniref:TonB-dependent receptor n=1 Tax=Shewanella intestini TaxID=2017544 RepID=A0ABS5I0A0_9GAMM|nr:MULTISPECIES: outer membrane protein transport protein [Shewanella]MBR9727459.1 TonB-dependent receptor [Shewanella intestini]MRG35491.1 aromatic hydrocarbon degradation protein [Shewanella sp. XMDDZSB0408]
MTKFNKTLLATAMTLISTQSLAAGFQLNSQSATGIGRAMAGDAIIADNASVLSRNPAAMALFKDTAISVGAAYADVSVKVSDVSFADGAVDLGGVDDAAEAKFIPNFYYINPINDRLAFGVAAFSNYGTGTDLTELSENAAAPYDLLGNTEVVTMNLNASMSYRINDQLSLGLGVDVIEGSGKLARSLPEAAGGIKLVDVDANGWAVGGIVGLAYEFNADNRIGLSYRLSPKMKASGDININSNPATPAESFDEINIPIADIAQLAGFHQLTDQFAIHYTAQWTQWSTFDNISVTDGSAGTTDQVIKHYNWKDSWFLSLGATYNVNDNWTLRAGIASDDGVVGEMSSLSIPDSDRMWYSAGVSYQFSKHSTIDFGYTSVVGEKVHVVEDSQIVGPVSAYTKSGANYFALQYNYQF